MKALFRSVLGICLGMAIAMSVHADGQLYIYNWTNYTPEDLVEKFEKETGIDIIGDYYDSNETLLAKLTAGGTSYDLAVPSQHFVEIMVQEGLLEKIDGIPDMPNYKYVDSRWRNPRWDPNQEYTVPYNQGSASFAFRADSYSGNGSSLKEFFEPNDEACGRLGVFKAPDEVINMAHLYLGSEFCSEDPGEMQAVMEVMVNQKSCVTMYSSEGINDRLANKDVIMHAHWDGYAHAGFSEGISDLTYAYPKEGVVGWFDSLVVPKGAKNIENAKTFMNFLMHPENMAMLSNFTAYANAIPESLQYMSDDIKNAQATKVPQGVPVVFGAACNENAQKLIDKVWTKVMQ